MPKANEVAFVWMSFRKGAYVQPPFWSPSLPTSLIPLRNTESSLEKHGMMPLPRRHAIHTLPPLSRTKQKYNRVWAFVLLAQNGSIWVQIVISIMKSKAIISTSLAVMQFKILCKNLGAEWKTQWDWMRSYREVLRELWVKLRKYFQCTWNMTALKMLWASWSKL